MPASLVESARSVSAAIRARADEAEEIRRLPAASVEVLTAAGLMRMCVPDAYGGPEADPMTIVRSISEVARADGSAGWCVMIASTTSSMAAFLPPDVARTIYGPADSVTGGVAAPNGVGEAAESDGSAGWTVTGRWPWGSGTQHSQWILAGVRCDGEWRFGFVPGEDVEFHDTWHTGGMRGSGSLDYSVENLFVPEDHMLTVGKMRPQVDTPLARFPNFTLLATGVAAVGLGIARRALDEVIDIAQGKRPQFSSRTLAKSGYTQVEVAKAESAWRAAQAFLLDELASAWELARRGDPVPVEHRVGIRLAAAHAASVGADVADTAYTLAGGTAVYETCVLGRLLRDAHVVTQHIQTAPKLNEPLGKALLGVDVDDSMF
jgi:alkylation response protein AidB-like acyl-CoA dehydrogenase